MVEFFWTRGLQCIRLPCPSPSPGDYSNSHPLSWWYYPTISSSVTPLLLLPSIFPVSGSFPMSQLFASVGQSIGASASASVLPMNIQSCFPLGLIDLISLQSKGLSKECSPAPQFWNTSSLALSLLYGPFLTPIHEYWKNHSLGYTDLCQPSDTLSRFVIGFLPMSKRHL